MIVKEPFLSELSKYVWYYYDIMDTCYAIDNWKPYQATLKPIKHEIYDLNLHVTWRNDVAASG